MNNARALILWPCAPGPVADPRELRAADAARPSKPLPRSQRLAGPFKVKTTYLERRAWPFCG